MPDDFDDLITNLSADADTAATDPANDFDDAAGDATDAAAGDATDAAAAPAATPPKPKRAAKAKTAPEPVVTPASDSEEYISPQTRAEMAAGAARVASIAAEHARMRELEAELEKSK